MSTSARTNILMLVVPTDIHIPSDHSKCLKHQHPSEAAAKHQSGSTGFMPAPPASFLAY